MATRNNAAAIATMVLFVLIMAYVCSCATHAVSPTSVEIAGCVKDLVRLGDKADPFCRCLYNNKAKMFGDVSVDLLGMPERALVAQMGRYCVMRVLVEPAEQPPT